MVDKASKEAKAKRTNHLLIAAGMTAVAAVTGLSVAGTMTAINAMNRQSDDVLASTRVTQQGTTIGGNGNSTRHEPGDVREPSQEPSQEPSVEPSVEPAENTEPSSDLVDEPGTETPVETSDWTSDQIKWMQENHIHFNEYGLPEDENGVLVDDPTTKVYDPARLLYFYNEDGTPKTPYLEGLPDNPEEIDIPDVSIDPIVPPDVNPVEPDTGHEDEPDEKPTDETQPDVPDDNPDDKPDDNSDDKPEEKPPVDSNPDADAWWLNSDGKLLDGLTLDEQGRPYYVVKAGDCLSVIGHRYGFAYMDLARENSIKDPNLIYVGDIIYFPGWNGNSVPGRG